MENGEKKAGFTPGQFALVLGLLIIGVFPGVAIGVTSFFARDYGVLGYPFLFHFKEALGNGEFPLWNPLSNCGAPFLAQWGTMSLYPGSLFYFLFPMPWSLGVFCLAHLFLGGMGMYYLARRWTQNDFAASVAGILFIFNGVTMSALMWPNYMVTLGWMPWLVGLAERAWREGGRRLIWTALVGALQVLAGVPELILFTWAIILGLAVIEFAQNPPLRMRIILRIAAVVALVTGLTAAQTLPFADLLAHSQRDASYATSKWSMPGWGWANLVVPLFHCFKTPQGLFFQQYQVFMGSYYLGLAATALAVLGALRGRQPRTYCLAGLVIAALILAMGEEGYVYSWLRAAFPWIGFVRFLVKFMLLPAFIVPLLAAYGICQLQDLAEKHSSSLHRFFFGSWSALLVLSVAILWFGWRYPFPDDEWAFARDNTIVRLALLGGIWVALGLLLRGRIPQCAGQIGIFVLLVIDIVTHTPHQNPTISADLFAPGWWTVSTRTPPPRHGEGRVFITPGAEDALLHGRIPDWTKGFKGRRMALWSNLNLLEGIPKVNGSSTLQIKEQKEIEHMLYNSPGTNFSALLDFLGTTWMTSSSNFTVWVPRPTALPLVTAGQQPIFDMATNILPRLTDPSFDPRRQVFLPRELQSVVELEQGADIRILSTQYQRHRLQAGIEAKAPGMVVIAQTYYHDWKATVDGQPVPLWRANHAFQALRVPAGRHEVILKYEDAWFRIGAAISLLSLGIGVFAAMKMKW